MRKTAIKITFIIFTFALNTSWLNAQDFTENIITKPNRWITPKYIDYDNDGDMDVASVSFSGNIAWWENIDGITYTKHLVKDTRHTFRDFDISDIDDDGDMDFVALELRSIYIYYNDGNDNFVELYNGFNFNASNIITGNFDADADIELVTSEGNNDGRLRVWNRQSNNFFQAALIGNVRVTSVGSLIAEDLDSDGDLDLVASILFVPSGSNSIFYYINDGTGVFTEQTISYTRGNYLQQVFDYNNDGHKDILIKSNFNCCITVFVNDGNLNFTEVELLSNIISLETFRVVDTDNDGDNDIVTIQNYGESKIGIYKNDGSENYTFQFVTQLFRGNYLFIQDINNDSLPEFLVGAESSDHPIIYNNLSLNSFSEIALDETFVGEQFRISDIDGDGLNDIITASNKLTLWRNLGNYEFDKTVIDVEGFGTVSIVDINEDGFKDIFARTYSTLGGGTMSVYFNDGNLNFTKEEYLSVNAQSAFFGDIDSDGDKDLIYSAGRPRYLRNDGGSTQLIFISQELNNAPVNAVLDINGDGHNDVFTNSELYYLNDGTSENFTEMSLPQEGTLNDLDGDGDYDIVYNQVPSLGALLAWYENDGTGNFTQNIISDPYRGGSIIVRDFDGDEDKDVITSPLSDFNSEGLILWRNDGNQNFTKNVIDDEYYLESNTLNQADLDGDGDIDFISSEIKYPFTIWNNDSDVPLSIELIDNELNFKVYPTLAVNKIHIETETPINTITILDIHGKEIDVIRSGNSIDVSLLSSGIYVIHIETDSASDEVFKFIKK